MPSFVQLWRCLEIKLQYVGATKLFFMFVFVTQQTRISRPRHDTAGPVTYFSFISLNAVCVAARPRPQGGLLLGELKLKRPNNDGLCRSGMELFLFSNLAAFHN